MNRTDIVDRAQIRKDIPPFAPGDTVKVHVRVVEGNRERVQLFQGVVTSRKGAGARETFTVRKLSFGVGVERTFPLHSPVLAKIEIVAKGQVRRAKLYYLRDRVGRAAKIRERRNTNLDELNELATNTDEQDPAETEAFAELAADTEVEAPDAESSTEGDANDEPADGGSGKPEPAKASEEEAAVTPAE